MMFGLESSASPSLRWVCSTDASAELKYRAIAAVGRVQDPV
jgi:hypothetical protein